ncbi:MAG: OmpA family protein [Desulfobacteraceae bacterium]|nr:MAG: OmpA family protein [Desulfobacteraceae bacterium]
MKNIATIVLSLVLAAAIISGLILYGKYSDTKDGLLNSEQKLSESTEKVTQLNQEIAALNDKIKENTEHLRELQNAKERAVELENAISMKDQGLSVFKEKLQNLTKQFDEEKKTNEALRTELSSRDTLAKELREKLVSAQSRITYLEEEMAKGNNVMQGLQRHLSDLKAVKATADTQMEQLKSTYDANLKDLEGARERISKLENSISMKDQRLSEYEEKLLDLEKQFEEEKKIKAALETELSSRDTLAKGFREKLTSAQSRITYLEDEIAKGKDLMQGLQRHLSELKGEKYTAETKIGQLKSTYEELVSDLKKQIENQEVAIKTFEEKISVTFVDRIVFEFGKAKISPTGREVLGKIGKTLRNVQGKQIRIVGHTDNIPILPEYRYKFPSNWELSAARAASVVNHLQNELGLDPANLEAVGRSFYEPIASNETAEGRAQNRRVNIIIAPKVE